MFYESKYRKGSEISDKELEDLISKSNFRMAKEYALYLLGYRSYSRNELNQKIRLKYGEDAAYRAICKIEELGFIDDEKYAKDLANKLFKVKKYAVKRIYYELLKRGIGNDLAEKIISGMSDSPQESIIELLNEKFRLKLSNEKDVKRTVASLQRMGYNFEDIKSALQEVCDLD